MRRVSRPSIFAGEPTGAEGEGERQRMFDTHGAETKCLLGWCTFDCLKGLMPISCETFRTSLCVQYGGRI